MILSEQEIKKQISLGNIIQRYPTSTKPQIIRLSSTLIANQSIDVRLGEYLFEFDTSGKRTDINLNGPYTLRPHHFYIAHTEEFIGTKPFSNIHPTLKLRSSAGRAGVINTLSGHGDVGFCNRWAMQFIVAQPVIIERYYRFAQIIFQSTTDSESYSQSTGNYQNNDDIEDTIRNWSPNQLLPKPLKI